MSVQGQEPPVIEEIELIPVYSKGELIASVDEGISLQTQPSYIRYLPLIMTVVVPMAIAIVYLFFIASNRYESEAMRAQYEPGLVY